MGFAAAAAASATARRQQRDGNVAFSRAQSGRRIHPSRRRVQRACAITRRSRRHRHAADAAAEPRVPLQRASAHAQRFLPRVAHRRRNVAAVEYAAARNANGNYSGANRIFDASRDWSARSAARVYPSFLLRFSPSLTVLFFSFTPRPRPSFLSVGLSSRRAGVFPFHLDPILNGYYTFEDLYAKPKNTLSRDGFIHSHGYERSAHDAGGSRYYNGNM